MKKVISYALFLLISWQILGFVAYFEFSHYKLKKQLKLQLKQGVPEEELISFTFDDSDLSNLIWIKKNEFKLKGNLFDVVWRKPLKNGKVLLQCISDEQEEQLFKNLNQGISSNLSDDSSPGPVLNWIKILQVPAVIPNPIRIEEISNLRTEENRFFIYQVSFETVLISLDTPPPNFS